MADGVFILIAAALLMTPGFLTDIVGFLCLVPGFRAILKTAAWKRLQKSVKEGSSGVFVQFGAQGPGHVKRSGPDSSGNIEM
jgi:UPF0716 protein FxsA